PFPTSEQPSHSLLPYSYFHSRYHAPADTFTNTFHAEHPWHWNTQYEARKAAEGPGSSRVQVLQDGSLYIDYVTRADAGLYRCIADNGIGPPVVRELVFTLKYEVLREVKKYGMMVGALSAASLLCIAVVIGLTRLIIRKCSEKERRKQKSIKEMLEHLEAYRGAKMEQLRECKDWFRTYRHNQLDNYNARVGKVKEACVGNMMLMQEHYNRRIAKIRDHCDCQIERLRESYNSQMSRIKDYKSNQVERVREQYNQQLLRIKDYAATQLERLRDQYKAQQAYLLKALDSVAFDNCMTTAATDKQLLNFRLDITPETSDSEDAATIGVGGNSALPHFQAGGGDEDTEDFVTAIGDDGDSRLDFDSNYDPEDNSTDCNDEDDDSGVSSQRIVVEAEVLPPPPPPPPEAPSLPLATFSASLPNLSASVSSARTAVEI
uniref:Ig-like domain-containing protein n=1 Tax=Macrostomum lignano TaxID=282301 RepID=A0A1I8H1V9_9PLAT